MPLGCRIAQGQERPRKQFLGAPAFALLRCLVCWYRTRVHSASTRVALGNILARWFLCAPLRPHCTASSITHCGTLVASRRRRSVFSMPGSWLCVHREGASSRRFRILGPGSWCPACLCSCVRCVFLSFQLKYFYVFPCVPVRKYFSFFISMNFLASLLAKIPLSGYDSRNK